MYRIKVYEVYDLAVGHFKLIRTSKLNSSLYFTR